MQSLVVRDLRKKLGDGLFLFTSLAVQKRAFTVSKRPIFVDNLMLQKYGDEVNRERKICYLKNYATLNESSNMAFKKYVHI